MSRIPKILLVGDLPRAIWCPPFDLLEMLNGRGVIELIATGIGMFVEAGVFDADAIICRPGRGGHLSVSNVQSPRRPLLIATLSKSIDHVRLPPQYVKEIVAVRGTGASFAVAEHTITLANHLLRPSDLAAAEMADVLGIEMESHSRQFNEMEWGCIGAGDQVRYLLPQLVARGCPRIRLFHPAMDRPRFEAAVSNMTDIVRFDAADSGLFSSRFRFSKHHETTVVGTSDLDMVLRHSDIISLHVPVQSSIESKYAYETISLIDSNRIARMKTGVYLINPCRGALVNEDHAVAAWRSGKIRGIAADSVAPKAEHSFSPQYSPLWREANNLHHVDNGHGPDRRIYLTPQVGGATREIIRKVSKDVLIQLLQKLEIPAIHFQSLKN